MTRMVPVLVLSASGLFPVLGTAFGETPPTMQASALSSAIAPQALERALETWAKQSGIQVMYATKLTRGIKSPGAPAGLAADEALKRILAGTGLAYRMVNAGAVSVYVAKESAGESSPADQMRVADSSITGSGSAKPEASEESADRKNQITVQGEREKPGPFTDANVDIPRTIGDAQPYYIFDSQTIERSGAVNIEDFLIRRLTMNTVALPNGMSSSGDPVEAAPSTMGNTSSINLRGLGAEQTLILVNGRRPALVNRGEITDENKNQPDLNGIPLTAIERIEVLPSSASGIYGGSAMAGVVNIILKRDFSGGGVRLAYENTQDGRAPKRTISATYGTALEGGKTNLMVSGHWSDSSPLLFGDRREYYERNLSTIRNNLPGGLASSGDLNLFTGVAANIFISGTPRLDDGTTLAANRTFISENISPSSTVEEVYQELRNNAGSFDYTLPNSTTFPNGLLRPLDQAVTTKSLQATLTRAFSSSIEMFAEFGYSSNEAHSVYTPLIGQARMSASDPGPFSSGNIRLMIPINFSAPNNSESETISATVGLSANLPLNWVGHLDYTRSKSRYRSSGFVADGGAWQAFLRSGAVNLFVHPKYYDLPYEDYIAPDIYKSNYELNGITLRAAGPLPKLPWGTPQLVFGVERQIAVIPEHMQTRVYPITVAQNYSELFYENKQKTDSLYTEAQVPLIVRGKYPLLYDLNVQLTGRIDRYTVNAGTFSLLTSGGGNEPQYNGPTLDGQPFFDTESYSSSNKTVGLRYQPAPQITLRTSFATAFLPPGPTQLIRSAQTDFEQYGYLNSIIDPTTGDPVDVDTLSGGNPNLEPQSSKTLNAGIIWEPQLAALRGLRFNAEFYRTQQRNAIGALGVQEIVDLESLFPERVTRDSSGFITAVDTSLLNLYEVNAEGWDLSIDYRRDTAMGVFNLRLAGSLPTYVKTQYALGLPASDTVGYSPAENGVPEYKGNLNAVWERAQWTAGWTASYVSAYQQYGVAGGPSSLRSNNGDPYTGRGNFLGAQGGSTIPSQTYHDLFISYAFPDLGGRGAGTAVLSGLDINLGVKNVFDKVPPFDAFYSNTMYMSPYGNYRLRSYWLSLTKSFD